MRAALQGKRPRAARARPIVPRDRAQARRLGARDRAAGGGAAHARAAATSGRSPAAAGERLATAYQVLQSRPRSTDAEVVKAYRRQMSRNHPDKLVANGLPESMMEIAKETTQRIREAYEADPRSPRHAVRRCRCAH